MPVAGLAVFAEDGLGVTYAGFAVAYLLARAVNQAEWIRAGFHVRQFRPVAARFLAGYVLAVAVILASFATTGAARVVLFALAALLEIATPTFTIAQQSALPKLSTSKFPERFGLLTIIVLGESVVGVIVGLSELQERGLRDGLASALACSVWPSVSPCGGSTSTLWHADRPSPSTPWGCSGCTCTWRR